MIPLALKPLSIFLIIVVLLFTESYGHPSWGIAVDEEGNLYFADVLHYDGTIWRLSKDGQLQAWIKDQHSHFIQLDKQGRVWGVDYEYLSSTDEWESTLWWADNHGKRKIVIAPTKVFEEFFGNSFLVDESGTIYFETSGQVYKRKGSKVRALKHLPLKRVMSMNWGPGSNIYLADNNEAGGSIFRMDTLGNMELITTDIILKNPPSPAFEQEQLMIMLGLWVDQKEDIYVTEIAGRRVVRIDNNGKKQPFFQSEGRWFPVGITSRKDTFYIMEVAYIPSKGHLGPRIIEYYEGKSRVLINISDWTQRNVSESLKPPKSPGMNMLK